MPPDQPVLRLTDLADEARVGAAASAAATAAPAGAGRAAASAPATRPRSLNDSTDVFTSAGTSLRPPSVGRQLRDLAGQRRDAAAGLVDARLQLVHLHRHVEHPLALASVSTHVGIVGDAQRLGVHGLAVDDERDVVVAGRNERSGRRHAAADRSRLRHRRRQRRSSEPNGLGAGVAAANGVCPARPPARPLVPPRARRVRQAAPATGCTRRSQHAESGCRRPCSSRES